MKKLTLAIIAVLGFVFGASAQADTYFDSHQVTVTIPSVALIDIEAGGAAKDITVAFTAPTEAGLPIVAPTTGLSTKWLNYSCILNGSGAGSVSRSVMVESSASVPSAITLGVTAGAPTGTGTPGTGGTVATISTTAQPLITGIGSVYTGNGTGNGSNITYALGLGTYSALVAGNVVVTVKYTLLDM